MDVDKLRTGASDVASRPCVVLRRPVSGQECAVYRRADVLVGLLDNNTVAHDGVLTLLQQRKSCLRRRFQVLVDRNHGCGKSDISISYKYKRCT